MRQRFEKQTGNFTVGFVASKLDHLIRGQYAQAVVALERRFRFRDVPTAAVRGRTTAASIVVLAVYGFYFVVAAAEVGTFEVPENAGRLGNDMFSVQFDARSVRFDVFFGGAVGGLEQRGRTDRGLLRFVRVDAGTAAEQAEQHGRRRRSVGTVKMRTHLVRDAGKSGPQLLVSIVQNGYFTFARILKRKNKKN